MNDKLIRMINKFHRHHCESYTGYYRTYSIRFNVSPNYVKYMPDILFHYYEYYTYI